MVEAALEGRLDIVCFVKGQLNSLPRESCRREGIENERANIMFSL